MVKKSTHPEFRLFEYLNGNIDENAAHVIEAHLSVCDDCASVVKLIRALKDTVSQTTVKGQDGVSSATSAEHPDLSELASFFYAKPRRATGSNVAAHVALCRACGEAIAQYSRAEHAAAEYNAATAPAHAVPAQAWEMIRDWEDSSFAQAKPAHEVLGQELLTRLTHILSEQQDRRLAPDASAALHGARVPVLIVSSAGEVRSVEFFDRELDATGASVLRHSEGSERFDNKPLLALFVFEEKKESFVVSAPVRRDTIRVERVRADEEYLRADYLIIED
jgi:hypothetical protein